MTKTVKHDIYISIAGTIVFFFLLLFASNAFAGAFMESDPVYDAGKRTSFQVTPDDTHWPTEKLTKDSLDGKAATGHDHSGTYLESETDPSVAGAVSTHAGTDDHPKLEGTSAWISGKTMNWFSTSIGAEDGDGVPGTYPALVGDLLNITVTNSAIGASHMYYDPAATDTPCASYTGVPRSLSATNDELQDKIDSAGATSAYHSTCQSSAGILANSYENMDFTKDVIVLDHGYNDRDQTMGSLAETWKTISSVTKGATTTVDTSAAHGLTTGDAFCIRILDADRDGNGIDELHNWCGVVFASCASASGRCATVTDADTIVLNVDSAAFGDRDSGDTNTLAEYDRAKYVEATDFILHNIYYVNPDAHVVFMNPPQKSRYTVASHESLINNIRDNNIALANKYGLPLLDMSEVMGLNELNSETWYTTDLIHPDEDATRYLIGQKIAGWFLSGAFTTGYQLRDADLSTIAGLSCAENEILKRNASGVWICATNIDWTGAASNLVTSGTITASGASYARLDPIYGMVLYRTTAYVGNAYVDGTWRFRSTSSLKTSAGCTAQYIPWGCCTGAEAGCNGTYDTVNMNFLASGFIGFGDYFENVNATATVDVVPVYTTAWQPAFQTRNSKASGAGVVFKITDTGLVVNTPYAVECVAGVGTAALTITPTTPYVEITNSDEDGCNITMGETGMAAGTAVTLCVVSNAGGVVTFADTAGVTQLAGALVADIDDCITLRYGNTTTWREVSRSVN